MLPPRRKPKKSGIERAPRREYPVHRAFVRRHACVVKGCDQDQIDVSHLRTAANSGTALKPPDWDTVSMCRDHHMEYHRIGHHSFERMYGLKLSELAAEFASRTTDRALREALQENRDAG